MTLNLASDLTCKDHSNQRLRRAQFKGFGKGTGGVDLFSNLLEGNSNWEDDSSTAKLSDDELFGGHDFIVTF